MTSETQQQQTELDAARAAFDASYRADLADPAYGPYFRISQRTHKLWLVWSRLQWTMNKTESSGGFNDVDSW